MLRRENGSIGFYLENEEADFITDLTLKEKVQCILSPSVCGSIRWLIVVNPLGSSEPFCRKVKNRVNVCKPEWGGLVFDPKDKTEEDRDYGGYCIEFFFFEGQIYLIMALEGCKLYHLTSSDPEKDWQWLNTALAK